MSIIRGSVIGLAGAVGVGVLAWPATAALTDNHDEVFIKRDEQTVEMVAVDDDDDADSKDKTNDKTNTNSKTGASKATNDNTRSNFTKMSRDRDKSRGDKTKDGTRDGGDRTRDWSANKTNDKSRNDTRGRR
jgi:hypothetical protein